MNFPKLPKDIWQICLHVFAWATRIPLAGLVVFAACCVSFVLFFFLYRLTTWIFTHFLSQPW